MKNLLNGPLPASALYLVLILLLAGGVVAQRPDAGASGSWWLSGWLGERAFELGGGAGGQGQAVLGALLLALLAGLMQTLVQAWTGNRIVGLFAGALLVVHDCASFAGPDAVFRLLPACWVTGGLLLRQRADARPAEEGSSLVLEGAALICLALAGFGGPVVAAFPVLSLVTAVVFQQGHERSSFLTRLLPRSVADVVIVAAFCANASAEPAGPAAGPAAGWRLLMGLSPDAALSSLGDVLGLLLACAGSASLVLGLATLRTHPRWLLLHFGTGTAWFLVCWVVGWLPGMPPGSWGSSLAVGGPALALGSLGWRAAMGAWARARTWSAPSGQPAPAGASPAAVDAAALEEALRVRVPALVGQEVARELEERRASRSAACPVPAAWEAAWQERRRAWRDRFLAEDGKTLGETWSAEDQQRNLLAAYVLPYAPAEARVLLLGPVPGSLVRDLAPHVFQVTIAGGSTGHLDELARDVADLDGVSILRTAGSGLDGVAAGSIDLVLSTQAFQHMEQADVYGHLLEIARLLRPGGHAILAFADLGDPLGREAFERQVARGTGAAGAVRFVTRDEVRQLVDAAGLRLDGLHLAATGRDFLAVITQQA